MDNKSIPSFFIIGVQKSATSFIHSLLQQDERISLPYRKETHFFSTNFHKGIKWYLDMFKSNNYNIRGEVDPSYIYYKQTLINIKQITKSPKFIIILRMPLDRAYSQYLMSKKRKYEKLSFNEALCMEKQRIDNDSNLFSFSNHSYMLRGNYSKQIQRYKQTFPDSKFLFIKFDDLINESRVDMLKNIYKFIEIDYNKNINFNTYKNTASSNRSELLSYFLFNDSKIRNIIKKIIPSHYIRYKFMNYLEKINSYSKPNIIKEIDYSSIDRKFIEWNNEQSILLNKSTNLNTENWIINE